MRKLTADDIKDLRAYEREREEFRAHIIELKKRRRIRLGPLVTVTFENTDTMRFQIQEMARVERMLDDEQIAHEVAVYNSLIPDGGELSGTLFIELTDEAQLREWLPKLVGIQREVRFHLDEAGDERFVPCVPEDEERLTREETTPAVHYLKFRFSPPQADALREGPAFLESTHPAYRESIELTLEQRTELASDLA